MDIKLFYYIDQAIHKQVYVRYLALLKFADQPQQQVVFADVDRSGSPAEFRQALRSHEHSPAQGFWEESLNGTLEVHFNHRGPDARARPHTFQPIGNGLYRCTDQRNLLLNCHLYENLDTVNTLHEITSGTRLRFFHQGRHEFTFACLEDGAVNFRDSRDQDPTPNGTYEILAHTQRFTAKLNNKDHTFQQIPFLKGVYHGFFTGAMRIVVHPQQMLWRSMMWWSLILYMCCT